MTTLLHFRDDWYASSALATVIAITERGGVVLDRTVFYPTGGGQPGDRGWLMTADGHRVEIAGAVWDDPEKSVIAHVPAAGQDTALLPRRGDTVTAEIAWPVRFARMRAHTCLHLLSVALPFPVTGGAVGDGEGRLDFDLPEMVEKEEVQKRLSALLATPARVTDRW
ncbi:MAG: alanine--tRNA ligase-related protein, partial [Beijerinckiaceae bacterium]